MSISICRKILLLSFALFVGMTVFTHNTKAQGGPPMIPEPFRKVSSQFYGEVIASGYARIEEAKPYLKHDRHSYMGFMYTVSEHRGKGVNWKIIEALEQWSQSQGVNEMRLEVYIDNLAAIRAYEKVGFAGYVLKMGKKLE